MTDLDSKARVAAAYRVIDDELRQRKLQAIWAIVATILLSVGAVVYFTATRPVGPVVRRPGTIIRTLSVADDTTHDVRLVIALDRGPSVLVPTRGVVPIGARVIVGERKNRLGWSTYAIVDREPESR